MECMVALEVSTRAKINITKERCQCETWKKTTQSQFNPEVDSRVDERCNKEMEISIASEGYHHSLGEENISDFKKA